MIKMTFLKLLFLFCFAFVVIFAEKQNEKRRNSFGWKIQQIKKALVRSGWPNDTFTEEIGSAATLNCNNIKYRGNPKKIPPIVIQWWKNGRRIYNISGKVQIYGSSKKPFIQGTKLNVSNISYNDAGTYTCKFGILNGTSSVNYVFEMNFTVQIKGYKLPKAISSSSTPKDDSIVLIMAGSAVGILLIGAVVTCLCISSNRSACSNSFRKRNENERWSDGINLDAITNSHKNSGNQFEESFHETTKFYRENTAKDLLREIEGEPNYVNAERYKDLFPFISDAEWLILKENEIDRRSLKCDVEHSMPIVLGTGNFGHVYRGEIKLSNGKTRSVAVKRLNDGFNPKELGHFLSEGLTLLKAGHHCNVISLIGSILLDTLEDVGIDQVMKKPPILLMDVASEGNLKAYLQSRRLSPDLSFTSAAEIAEESNHFVDKQQDVIVGKDLTLKDLTSFSYQVARGMDHLASKHIVHRDLAARNVLLTSDRVIKIADFGLSKHIRNLQQEYYRIHSPTITPAKWTAPEALRENTFSVKSDVWSYGVLLWEIYSMGAQPYLGVPVSQLYNRLCMGLRLEKPAFSSAATYFMMKRCWNWKNKERPDFKELVGFFDNTLLSVSQPYVELSESRDSAFSGTHKSNSEAGSDSVFEYAETESKRSGSTISIDSACIATSSTSSSKTLDNRSDMFTMECNETALTELINPLYQG